MCKPFSFAAVLVLMFGTAQAANAAGGRRYYYRSIPSDSAAVRQPAAKAPAAQAQTGRQTYRRYSAAPGGAAQRSSTRSAPARMGRSPYGPSYWRADRKILGY